MTDRHRHPLPSLVSASLSTRRTILGRLSLGLLLAAPASSLACWNLPASDADGYFGLDAALDGAPLDGAPSRAVDGVAPPADATVPDTSLPVGDASADAAPDVRVDASDGAVDASVDATADAGPLAVPTLVGYAYDGSRAGAFDFATNGTHLAFVLGSSAYACPLPCSTPARPGSAVRLANTAASKPASSNVIAIDGATTAFFQSPTSDLVAWDVASGATSVVRVGPVTELFVSGPALYFRAPTTRLLPVPGTTQAPPRAEPSHHALGGDLVEFLGSGEFSRNGVPIPGEMQRDHDVFVSAPAKGSRPALIVATVLISGTHRLRICRGDCTGFRAMRLSDTSGIDMVRDLVVSGDALYVTNALGVYRASLDALADPASGPEIFTRLTTHGGERLRASGTELYVSRAEPSSDGAGVAQAIYRVNP
jgi:hypothetical protein